MSAPHHRTRFRTIALAGVIALVALACADPDGATTAADAPAGAPPGDDAAQGPAATASTDHPPMPSLALTTFAGEAVDLRDFVGTPLVVNFWASWCPPCAAEMPDFQAVSQLAGDQVDFVGINISDSEDLADALAEHTGVTYQLLRDPGGAAFAAFGGIGMPTTVFIDATGGVVGGHTGLLTRDALIAEVEEQLDVELPS